MAAAPATCSAQPAHDHGQIARYMRGADSRYISDALMRDLYPRDNGTCQKCFRAVGPRAARFDHIVPWSEDGGTVPWNLQILCESCNLAKGNRMDDQDHEKLAELSAGIWSLYVAKYILTEYLKYIRGFASLSDTQKRDVQRLLRDFRDMLDDFESSRGAGE